MQTVKDYWVNDNIDGIAIYDINLSETVYEGELDKLVNWLKEEFDIITKCKQDRGFLEITCEDGNKYIISSISDIEIFFDEYASGDYSLCYYRIRSEIVPDTMFLTLRECKEHIKLNSHHYNKPHSYAMTAWRSPQVARLYEILEKTDWKNF
jgi:hypothetical protein